MMTMISMKLDH